MAWSEAKIPPEPFPFGMGLCWDGKGSPPGCPTGFCLEGEGLEGKLCRCPRAAGDPLSPIPGWRAAGTSSPQALGVSWLPLPCWRIRDHPDPAIRQRKTGKARLGSAQSPPGPGPPAGRGLASPRMNFRFFGTRPPANMGEMSLPPVFPGVWSGVRPSRAGQDKPPAPKAAVPARPLRAPGAAPAPAAPARNPRGFYTNTPKFLLIFPF